MTTETTEITVHLKAAVTTIHDVRLLIRVPAGIADDRAAIRRWIEDLDPAVLTAACTDQTVDRSTDAAPLDVMDIEPSAAAVEGERDDH